MAGLDLTKVVTCDKAYEAQVPEGAPAPDLHVVAYDYGIKRTMLGYLAGCGFRVTVVPAQTSAKEVLKLAPDGVFLSNGPGDPAAVTYAIKTIERLLGKVPIFGICLGHQLLGAGARRQHLQAQVRPPRRQPAGARTCAPGSSRSPRRTTASRSTDESAAGAEITHVNLNDGTVEGVASAERFAFSRAVPPRSRPPGPHDSLYLFDRFRDEIDRFKRGGEA